MIIRKTLFITLIKLGETLLVRNNQLSSNLCNMTQPKCISQTYRYKVCFGSRSLQGSCAPWGSSGIQAALILQHQHLTTSMAGEENAAAAHTAEQLSALAHAGHVTSRRTALARRSHLVPPNLERVEKESHPSICPA